MKRRAAFGEVRAFAEALFFMCILVDAAPRANARALADAAPEAGGGRFAARMGFLDRILAAGTARSSESNDGDGGIEETCRSLDPFYGCSIDTIIVRDNRHTKPASILREMATKQGDCLDERLVRRDAAYLRGLGYFTKVDMSAEQSTPGACRLVVSVVDRPGLFMRFPYPVVNYDFEKGISYGFAWKLKNFRGNAEDLSLSAVRRQDEEQGAGFSWSNPWFTGRRIRFGLDIGAYRRIEEPFEEDEDYIRERVSAGVGVGIPLSKSIVRQLRISPAVGYEARISRRTLADGAGNLETSYYRQNFLSTGGEIEFDSRSDRISPFDGVVAEVRAPRPRGDRHVDRRALGADAHLLGSVERQRPQVARLQLVRAHHLALRLHQLLARVRHLHHEDLRGVEQPVGVLLQPEDPRAGGRLVRAHALEDGEAVVQRVRQDVRRGVAPRHQLAVVPDETVAVRHRHRVFSL